MQTWGPVVLSPLLAGAYAVLAAGVGARVRRLARLPLYHGLKLPFDFCLGVGVLSLGLLLLGFFGLYRPGVLALFFVFAAVGSRFRHNNWRWQPLLPGGVASLVLLPMALAQPFFYDALVYHLALPWQALLEGGWHPHPETIYAAGPPLAQLCALPFLALRLPQGYSVFHLLSFVASGAALGTLGRLLGGKVLPFVAAFCLPLVPLFVLVPALPAAEGWGFLALTTATALLYHRYTRPWAGLLGGFAVASRLQLLPLALVLLLLASLPRKGARSAVRAVGGFLIGSFPWWGKNWLLLGDPLLPLGSPAWETLSRDAQRMPVSLANIPALVGAAWRTLAPHASYALPLALAALAAVWTRPSRRTLEVGVLAMVGLASWPLLGFVTRYLAGASPFWLALPTAARSRGAKLASGLALGVTAVVGTVVSAQQLMRWGGLALAAPGSSLASHLVVNNPLPAFHEARELPAKARVLFVGEPRGFGFPRLFVAPSHLQTHPLVPLVEGHEDVKGVLVALRRQGFTHLLVNWGELARLTPGYPCAPWRTPAGRGRFFQLIETLQPPVVSKPPVAIYALSSPLSPPS